MRGLGMGTEEDGMVLLARKGKTFTEMRKFDKPNNGDFPTGPWDGPS